MLYRAARRRASIRACALCLLVGMIPAAARAGSIVPVTVVDPIADAAIRKTDPGADGVLNLEAHSLPDIRSYTIDRWKPHDPALGLFDGQWDSDGQFVRLDLVFDGVVNPPGTMGREGQPWDPFKYGPNPVFGIVEIDVEPNIVTGGELEFPQFRFQGNAARWGGMPRGDEYIDRIATSAAAFDQNVLSPPYVELCGEDLHVSFLGQGYIDPQRIRRSDSANFVFGAGETWIIPAPLFHRSHSYEQFSYAGEFGMGDYEPDVEVRFRHELTSNRTTVTLVYPLTNEASRQMRGEQYLEMLDGNPTNQNSILEALDDLVFSTIYPKPEWLGDPLWGLIQPWSNYALWPEENNVGQFLDPANWRLTILVGGTYTVYEGQDAFAWSDVMPNVKTGDFNGNGVIDQDDIKSFYEYLTRWDGDPEVDADGTVDGTIRLESFGINFNLYDTTYDGRIDTSDRPKLPVVSVQADFDRDGDVDPDDYVHFRDCFTGPALVPPADGCYDADLDGDYDIDQGDFGRFQVCLSGSGVVADLTCEN